jgi:Na+-translocating ferredoxin:NAD+ oxidoreductase RnfG subunit
MSSLPTGLSKFPWERWAFGAGMMALVPAPLIARAEIYLSDEQAVQLMFPGEKFTRKELTLTDDQAKKIEDASNETVRNRKLVAWISPKKNIVLVDQVLGKHEFITMAAGIDAEGKIRGVEILEYRETYGGQVRGAEWRKQFVGKDKSSKLKLGDDIKNISGATLSSAHVTAGMRRLVQTYDVVRATL